MAGFHTESQAAAEAVLRDFPENWTREAGSIGPNGRTFYRCKSDPTIIAVVERLGPTSWFTGIDQEDAE